MKQECLPQKCQFVKEKPLRFILAFIVCIYFYKSLQENTTHYFSTLKEITYIVYLTCELPTNPIENQIGIVCFSFFFLLFSLNLNGESRRTSLSLLAHTHTQTHVQNASDNWERICPLYIDTSYGISSM